MEQDRIGHRMKNMLFGTAEAPAAESYNVGYNHTASGIGAEVLLTVVSDKAFHLVHEKQPLPGHHSATCCN